MLEWNWSTIKYKAIIIVLIVLLILLQWSLWGDRGFITLFSMDNANEKLQETNKSLIERNQSLTHQIQDLKEGVGVVEERAREDLGMVKKGETFFKIIDRRKSQENHQEER